MANIHNEMLHFFQQGHPAPWAIFDADENLLNEALESEKLWETFECIAIEEMMTDTDREARNLIDMYKRSSKEQRMIIDAVFVFFCGWSLPSILEKAKARRTAVSNKRKKMLEED